jgi:hypothetical protein
MEDTLLVLVGPLGLAWIRTREEKFALKVLLLLICMLIPFSSGLSDMSTRKGSA